MTARNYFTPDEITLCTYAAIYDGHDFGGVARIEELTNRSSSSIKMKIQKHRRDAGRGEHSSLQGESGRTTNWEQVQALTRLSKTEFLSRCRAIACGRGSRR